MAANNIGNAALVLSTSGGKLSEGLDKTSSEIQSFASRATTHMGSLGSGISNSVTSGLSGIGTKLAGFLRAGPHIAAAAAVGLVIYEAIAAPLDKLKELGGLQKKADVLGINASQLQGMTQLLGRFGVEGDAVNDTFAKMGKNVYDAGQGLGKAAGSLKALGIDAKSIATLAPDEQFKAIADEIAKLPPGAQQASAALHIFGNAGADLLPILQKGGKGIQDFIEEQKKTGAVLSDPQIKAAADAQKAWKESKMIISETWEGLVNRATLVAAPIVKLIGGIVKKGFSLLTPIFDWLGRAMERVSIIVERVGEVLEQWFDIAYKEVRNLLAGVQDFTGEWPTVEEVVTGVLKNTAVALAYVWDTLKAGAGAMAYVLGFIVEGFGNVVKTFKDTVKDLLEVAGELPDVLGGKFFRDKAKEVDGLGNSIVKTGEKLKDWGKGTFNNFGNSAKDVGKWFDNLDLKRKELAKKKLIPEDSKEAEYKAVASIVKGSKEAYSIESKFKFDGKMAGAKEPAEKALDEAKKANALLQKLVDKFRDIITLKAA